ncbi:MAG: heme ABC transporter substrate-binding protein IsdE [Candidatus Cohnella colombiensis]|uniref:High-affinity heme uptake system protein IsdE n=1 Tax=Candidatus Cohnella colombiensis TaxID=3121368 RepID=A0AA95EW40_9BACL|nr:MAG: heme ABC transporter substrate-binding protein IsdE [Cohnella sp.]
MKPFVLVTITAVLLLITGCSPSSNDSGSTPSPSDSASEFAQTKQTAEVHRVISTTVAITEIMDALDMELVGIPTSAKKLPIRYAEVTEVGSPMSPDMEVVKMLKPTEILSVTTLESDLKPSFESAGIQATFLDLTSLDKMKKVITELGSKYDRADQAAALVKKFDDKVADIKQRTANVEKPKVLILLGVPGSYLVATEHSYIGDLVKLVGGVNIVQGESVEYLASNTEYLQQGNPDVILRASHGMPDEVIKMFDLEFKRNDIWKHFDAVSNDRVYDLPEELFGTTGALNVDESLEALVGMLYP